MIPTQADIRNAIFTDAAMNNLSGDKLLKQCIAESSLNVNARNETSGALGLFQLEPATAKSLGVNPLDWRANIEGGVRYMAQLVRQFGNYDRALAAYNWGPGNMEKLLASHPASWRDHVPAETAAYLKKILG